MGGYLQRFRTYIFSKFKAPTILVMSFAFLILTGAILLCFPFANAREPMGFVDNLFTATTSTCVTGLTVTSIGDQYNTIGHIIILLLIQFGGLGLMTFISIVLVYLHNNLEFKERTLLKDALNKLDYDDIRSYIKDIFKFTAIIEIIGALLLATQLIPMLGVVEGAWNALFLSVSAFCCAGIDIFSGTTSLIPYNDNPVIILTIAVLIISGGLGFAVWIDWKRKLGNFIALKRKLTLYAYKFRYNTRLVVHMTITILLFGTIFVFISEYNGALKDMSFLEKLMNAFFNTVTLRTAGFSSFDYSIINRATKMIMIIIMFIGGSPGGTAGGIKTTTFFLLMYALYCQLSQRRYINFFGRHIKKTNFMSAYAIFMMYLLVVMVTLMIMMVIEPYESIDILFEIISAIGTVGLTIGITPDLTVISKLLIILMMFVGRVGPITIAYAIRKKAKRDSNVRYPVVDVIVG